MYPVYPGSALAQDLTKKKKKKTEYVSMKYNSLLLHFSFFEIDRF